MKENFELIRFNVLRNALYHVARRRSLERINRFFNFLVILLGTAAFGDLLTLQGFSSYSHWLGAAIAFIGALQLVFDFGRQARDHEGLQREYYHLLADIEAEVSPTPEQSAEWYSRMVRITAGENPVLRAVDAKAYNDAIGAMEWDEGERLIIPFWQKPFQTMIAFEGHQYRKLNETKRWSRLFPQS